MKQRFETKFGTFIVKTGAGFGYQLQDINGAVIQDYDNDMPLRWLKDKKSIPTNWNDFVEWFCELTNETLMWALTLQELKNEFFAYQVEELGEECLKKRESNKIVNKYVFRMGEHYCLYGFENLIWG